MSGQPMLAGIHRSLKDSDTPWQDRLKLARFAWSSSQCFLPNKQQVLLDWVCYALTNQTKFGIPDDVVCSLWQYLHDVLHSKQLQLTSESAAAVYIRDAIYPVFCDVLSVDGKYVTMVTACCHVILQSPSLCRSLTAKYDLMVDLLSALMQLITKCLDTGDTDQETAVACLQMLMKKFAVSHRQRQLQAHRKAFTTVYEKLLIPALGLYTCENAVRQPVIRAQIEDLIGTGVFNKDMCEFYTKYLTLDRQCLEAKDKHLEAHFNDIDNLLEFLVKETRNTEGKDAMSRTVAGLPVLFTTFIAAYKPTPDVVFAMCKKLCGIMGISPDSEDSGIASSTSCDWRQVLPALEQILETLLSSDVYVIAVDNADGKPKFQWFHQLLQIMLNQADRSCASFFKCLHLFLDLNHLIIEEQLALIWNVSLVQQTPDDAQKADNLEESRTEFLGALMQTYTKLRQFDKLLECLLASYRDKDSTSGESVYFHTGFVHRFCDCIQELPPGLTLDLWKLFKDDLIHSYISRLSESANKEPPKKKRKSTPHEHMSGLEQTAVTFHLFLTAARLVDLSVTMAMKDRLETLVEEMQTEVLQPLHDVCKNMKDKPSESLLFSTLLMTYTMGDLQLVLLQHTKYGSSLTKYGTGESDEEAAKPAYDILKRSACVGDFLDEQQGEKDEDVLSNYEQSLGSEDVKTRYLVDLIRTQQARAVLLYTSSEGHGNTEAIMRSLSSRVLAGDASIESDATTWDGQIASLSGDNYTIAYLHFLTKTLPIWLPYTSPQHHHQVASLLVQAFNSDTTMDGTSGVMTPGSVAKAFMCSDVCMESKDLQSALLVAGMTSLGNSLSSVSPKKAKKSHKSSNLTMKCGQLLSMLAQVTDSQDEHWETLETVGKEYSGMLTDDGVDNGTRSKKMQALLKNANNVLNVLRQLPLTHLLPGNQDRCMLGLIIIDSMLSGWLVAADTSVQAHLIETLLLCRKLEMKILQATKSTGLLKCFSVGAMLTDIISKHSEAWQRLLETNQLNQDEWKSNYMELDDITQKLIVQWMQKVADRVTHEGSVMRDVTSLLQEKLSALRDQIAESSSPISDLFAGVPLLSTTATIIHSSPASQQLVQSTKGRSSTKFVKSICVSVQELISSVVSDVQGEVDPLLVGCLAKGVVGLMTSMQVTTLGEVEASSADGHDGPVAMETEESSPVTSLKNSERLLQSPEIASKSDAEIVEMWQGVLHPVLGIVLDQLERNCVSGDEFDHQRNASNDRRTSSVMSACLDCMRGMCEFVASHRGTVGGEAVGRIWRHLVVLMSVIEDDDLKDHTFSIASYVLTCMNKVQFSDAVEQSLGNLTATELSPGSVASLRGSVLTWQVMSDSQLSEENHKLLLEYVPKALTSLQCLLVEAVRDWPTGGALTVCILTALKTLVASGKKLLEPKQAMQTLQACLTVQFTSVPDGLFPSVFTTLYLMLKCLLQAFPQTVLHCIAVYMASLQHMLCGIMHKSHQQLGDRRHIEDQELFTCAENMERLLTQISSHKKDVSKFVIVLISEYISELQKGTLLPFVKKTLVVGVYNLVDICDEKALALLQSMLPINLKEIYTEFYSDYKKYHKYKGKV